ncbi:MAG: DUF3836 domain-containing protein [Prevotella sp.]|nr:DUF3836 domain-containing protein [Prevotella sp.]
MNVIITVFTIMSMYLNLSQSTDNMYYYNADTENGAVTTLYVYEKNAGFLTPKLCYHFDYDNHGRLTERISCKWNAEAKSYLPKSCLRFNYAENNYELSHCTWNNKTCTWNSTDEKMLYSLDSNHLDSVTHILVGSNDETTIQRLFILAPQNDNLFAGK